MSLRFLTLIAAVLVAAAVPSRSAPGEGNEQPIPKDSLVMLEQVFARVNDHLWEESDDFFHDGFYERSIRVLRLVVEIDPTDAEAYSVGSWLMDSKGRDADGIAFLELGLSRNPNHYDLHAELGYRYDHMGNYSKAAEYFEAALKFPDCPSITRHALAHAYEKSGQLEKSVKAWEDAAKVEPNDPVVKNNLERVRNKLAEKKSQEQK